MPKYGADNFLHEGTSVTRKYHYFWEKKKKETVTSENIAFPFLIFTKHSTALCAYVMYPISPK